MLIKTIQKLERYAADTLNTNRYAEKAILAYAYDLQYEWAKPADSVKALQYLAKAAESSPKNSNEKAYVSFYDRHFLQSQESYREEFITRLFNSANKEQALGILAEHINAEPASIKDMQAVYETHFPGKRFKDFFAANVITTWQTAPAFVLKGLDGNELSLSSFKGKWLVIDFWGTWCSPCRGEMPAINAFNNELKAGKYKDVNFLSVACRDNEANVKAYFASNKFEVPYAMANATIEQQYHIFGYPSKEIISPDGKMLPLRYGDDWEGIVKQFSDLSAVN